MLLILALLQTAVPAPLWTRPPVPLAERTLIETSALVRSPSTPGVFWTLNDSGNKPELFAIDTGGRALARIRVDGGWNIDWEALASGPCLPEDRITLNRCLYIGDIGDNARIRSTITIYRVAEPVAGRDSVIRVLGVLQIVYPDSARDAESLVVDPRGDMWIVSKELVREPRVYRIPAAAWHAPKTVVAEFVAILPIPSASGIEEWTTDADWAAQGNALMVRTYGTLWRVPFINGRPQPAGTRAICRLTGLGPQGEGLASLGGGVYALTSERLFGAPASIAMARCAE